MVCRLLYGLRAGVVGTASLESGLLVFLRLSMFLGLGLVLVDSTVLEVWYVFVLLVFGGFYN